MSGRTTADVDALEAVTAELLPTLEGLRGLVDTYRRALHALLAAPSDLAVELEDHAPELDDLADLLTLLDQFPAAFAVALRFLDHRSEAELAAIGCDVRAAGDDEVERFAALRLQHPTATLVELRRLFSTPRAPLPPNRGVAHAHWLVGVVDDVDTVASIGGALPVRDGATVWARASKVLRTVSYVTNPVVAALPAYEQYLADRHDHNLTDGDRTIGMASATAFEGGGALAGAATGAKGGAAVGSLGGPHGAAAGLVVGGVGGAVAGARGGRRARRTEPVRTLEDRAARQLDRQRGTGHRDTYERDHGIRSGR